MSRDRNRKRHAAARQCLWSWVRDAPRHWYREWRRDVTGSPRHREGPRPTGHRAPSHAREDAVQGTPAEATRQRFRGHEPRVRRPEPAPTHLVGDAVEHLHGQVGDVRVGVSSQVQQDPPNLGVHAVERHPCGRERGGFQRQQLPRLPRLLFRVQVPVLREGGPPPLGPPPDRNLSRRKSESRKGRTSTPGLSCPAGTQLLGDHRPSMSPRTPDVSCVLCLGTARMAASRGREGREGGFLRANPVRAAQGR